ncbi:MAG: recombinase family protein [Acidimicrobiales bacterium]
MLFAFYGRVSTEDAQDPAASRAWQLRRSNELVRSHGGEIVAEYFDLGQSRSLPWKRRPEANRLLEDLPNTGRGWEAVVIGEPSRAFYGSQFALTFPLFTHYRVGLWVPEVGGAIDPGSEAHDLVMNLFGGLSKGERTRIQVRVRSAMEALASEGDRFLGGRPPYGYRLADAGPHPNPSKAVAGQRLHRLEPDPITATYVRRIFSMYASGHGLRLIAERLTEEGIPSPAAYDRARKSHRDPRGWSHTAIRAILTNPIYGGRSVWGKQRRFEELLDLNDVSAGHVTRMRWRASSEWIEATTPRTQALVDEATLAAVANRIGGGARREKQRDVVHPYLLRGIVRCDLCGRRMQGSARRSRIEGSPTRVLYRCEFGARRSVPLGMDHPPTVYVREDAIVPRLDAWLAEIVTPEALASAQAMPPDVAAQHVAVRTAMADCDVRSKRLLESIESGIDHELVAPRVRELQAERSRLAATLGAYNPWRPLSTREIAEWADSLGGMVQVLKQANPEDRAALYAELGLTLRYDPTRQQIKATAELSRVARGVGGGTRSICYQTLAA